MKLHSHQVMLIFTDILQYVLTDTKKNPTLKIVNTCFEKEKFQMFLNNMKGKPHNFLFIFEELF